MRPERGSPASQLALAACAGAFALGLAGLFRDRLEVGDIYPPGSSLRSDPLGSRALFEALDRLPGVEAARAYSRADLRGTGQGDAILFLGLDAKHPPAAVLRQMDTLARAGARVIGVFSPGKAPSPASPAAAAGTDSAHGNKPVTVTRILPGSERPDWGFRVRLDSGLAAGTRRAASPPDGGPDSVPVTGIAWFDSLAPEWSVRYSIGKGRAAGIERPLGKGSVALASDGYFASNEAQREEGPARPARMAAWLVGNSRRVLFEERHLGIRRDEGMVDLLARHRAHHALPALALLLFLALWRMRARPGPAFPETAEAGSVPDTRSALAGLLRRSLGDRGVLENCLRLWSPSSAAARAARPADGPEGDPRVREILSGPPKGPEPLARAYTALQSLLNPRKTP